jgi:hypothetical protein
VIPRCAASRRARSSRGLLSLTVVLICQSIRMVCLYVKLAQSSNVSPPARRIARARRKLSPRSVLAGRKCNQGLGCCPKSSDSGRSTIQHFQGDPERIPIVQEAQAIGSITKRALVS